MNRNKMDDRFLTSVGFVRCESEYKENQEVWSWGKYTVVEANGNKHMPIIEWNEETGVAYASPINYSKPIMTVHAMEQFMNTVNFLMSTEH